MTFFRKLVVGMHLYGEVLTRIDELYEQREVVAEFLIHLLAEQQPFVFLYELCEAETYIDIIYQSALYGDTLVSRHAGNLPRFADVGLCGVYALEWRYLIAAPYRGFQDRFEFVWFHSFVLVDKCFFQL